VSRKNNNLKNEDVTFKINGTILNLTGDDYVYQNQVKNIEKYIPKIKCQILLIKN
jgi:hypothetical protein